MKRNLFSFILLALLTAAITMTAAAQSPDKILKQANRALGGEKALQAIKSWRKTGRITRLRDGASGIFEEQAAQPNFYNSAFDLNGFEMDFSNFKEVKGLTFPHSYKINLLIDGKLTNEFEWKYEFSEFLFNQKIDSKSFETK